MKQKIDLKVILSDLSSVCIYLGLSCEDMFSINVVVADFDLLTIYIDP